MIASCLATTVPQQDEPHGGMDAWVARSDEGGPPRLALSPEGLSWRDPSGRWAATWDQVLGVTLLPADEPSRAFVLVPRRPPEPPWFEVRPEHLPAELRGGGLAALARRIDERLRQRSYRDAGPRRLRLDPETLLRLVLAREEVPGALEVPVGAGPGGWWRRALELAGGGSAGGLAGLYAGTLAGSGLIAGVGAVLGAVTGAAAPVLVGPNWRSVRDRRKRPRVLVLAPDGCVVGLPTGPAVFDWRSLRGFGAGEEMSLRDPEAAGRPCLEIVRADGSVAARIDAAWFTQPLPLIVGVAEAYRRRCVGAQAP